MSGNMNLSTMNVSVNTANKKGVLQQLGTLLFVVSLGTAMWGNFGTRMWGKMKAEHLPECPVLDFRNTNFWLDFPLQSEGNPAKSIKNKPRHPS